MSNHSRAILSAPHLYFEIQNHGITLDQWLTILTLCIAPLAAHIALGVSEHVSLGNSEPSWSSKLVLFNPVSIAWRYYAIAYRRLVAWKWDRNDMAATNAIFWEDGKWDGSDRLLIMSQDWATKLPTKSHTTFVSASMIGTAAITLQGLQAAINLGGSLIPDSEYRFHDSLRFTFVPLGMLGLIRLLAARWLSGEYGFTDFKVYGRSENVNTRARLLPSYFLKARVFRACWLLSLAALTALCLIGGLNNLAFILGPKQEFKYQSVSWVVEVAMYLVLMVGCFGIHAYYVLLGRVDTTVLPCINTLWYRLYTILLALLALTVVILSALQTRISPCGKYTTFPKSLVPELGYDPACTTGAL